MFSWVFFAGPPCRILEGWRAGRVQLVISHEILEEYQRVGDILAVQFPGVDLQPRLDLVTMNAEIFSDKIIAEPVCEDPDDDKFIACAMVSGCKIIVSGDKHLLKLSGFGGITGGRLWGIPLA